jgi:hypothetical protein
MGVGFLSLRVKNSRLLVRRKEKYSKSLNKKIQKDIVTQWALFTELGRTCSCGLHLREGILPLSVLALLDVLGSFQ